MDGVRVCVLCLCVGRGLVGWTAKEVRDALPETDRARSRREAFLFPSSPSARAALKPR